MLVSMTGFGEATVEQEGLRLRVEVRSINSRYLKVSVRNNNGIAALESRVEAVVRNTVRRGQVQVSLSINRQPSSEDFQVHTDIIEAYWTQLVSVAKSKGAAEPRNIEWLLSLPGVITERTSPEEDPEGMWPLVEATLAQALAQLDRMRRAEGEAMAADLLENCRAIAEHLDVIQRQAPQVVDEYRQRLTERVNRILAEHDLAIESADVIREVALFADRSDISEEVVRLRSHLEQFSEHVRAEVVSGRKLDFLTQEMVREVNTIGAKANDVTISRHVVEVKAIVERIREMVQNVE